MTVIVDTNIIFSGILNSNGKIADLLLNSNDKVTFIAPDFLRSEIRKHYIKLSKISKLDIDAIQETESLLYQNILFISEEQIKESNWKKAVELVNNVDENDVVYIAFALQFKCKVWSGDKKLIAGLKNKAFTKFFVTDDLYKIVNK